MLSDYRIESSYTPAGQGRLSHVIATAGERGPLAKVLQSGAEPRCARISPGPGPVCTPRAEGIQSNGPGEPDRVQPAECPAPSQSGPPTRADNLCKVSPAGLSGCSRNLLEHPGADTENAGRLVPGLSEPVAPLDTTSETSNPASSGQWVRGDLTGEEGGRQETARSTPHG